MQEAFARIVEQRLQHVAPILSDVVLVGGAAVGIVLSDPGAAPARPTNDVDLVVAVDTRIAYERVAERLRGLGLVEDSTSDVICRWRHSASGTIYDVMPTSGAALGFTNEWYEPAFGAATPLTLPGGLVVRCATVPHLLAMKLVAFDDRGEDDYLASHDMNDFVAMIDGVPDIVERVREADGGLQAWLAARITVALVAEHHHDMLLGYLMPDEGSQQRRALIEDRLRLLAREG